MKVTAQKKQSAIIKIHPKDLVSNALGPDYIVRIFDAYWTRDGRWRPLHAKSRRPHEFEMRVEIQSLKGLPKGTVKICGKAYPIRTAASLFYGPKHIRAFRGLLGSEQAKADLDDMRQLWNIMPRLSASQIDVLLKRAAAKYFIRKPMRLKVTSDEQLLYKKTTYSNLRSVWKDRPDMNNNFLVKFSLPPESENRKVTSKRPELKRTKK